MRPMQRPSARRVGTRPSAMRFVAGEVGGAAGGTSGSQDAGFSRPPAHAAGEHDPGAPVRVRHRCRQGHPQRRAPAQAAGDLPDAARPAVDLLAEQLRQTQEKIETVTTEDRGGTERPTRSRGAWRPSPASAPSRRARSPRRRPRSTPSGRHGTTPPAGSGSRRSRIRAAARSGWAGSPRLATDICAGCSTSVRWRRSARAAGADPARTGSGECCRGCP